MKASLLPSVAHALESTTSASRLSSVQFPVASGVDLHQHALPDLHANCIAVAKCALWYPYLQFIQMRKQDLVDSVAATILDALSENPFLLRLDLCDNRLTDKIAPQLQKFMTRNSSVVVLQMARNQLGDAAAKAIFSAMNSVLLELDLNDNKLSAGCLPALIDMLQRTSPATGLPSIALRSLALWGLRIEQPESKRRLLLALLCNHTLLDFDLALDAKVDAFEICIRAVMNRNKSYNPPSDLHDLSLLSADRIADFSVSQLSQLATCANTLQLTENVPLRMDNSGTTYYAFRLLESGRSETSSCTLTVDAENFKIFTSVKGFESISFLQGSNTCVGHLACYPIVFFFRASTDENVAVVPGVLTSKVLMVWLEDESAAFDMLLELLWLQRKLEGSFFFFSFFSVFF
jgi:hypothetical protein